jgi:predicted MFS family arabinose efflux permease
VTYLGELRQNWRYAAAAMIGMGFGYSLFFYAGSIFAPPLIGEFGWSKAQFALLGTILLVNLVCLPAVGRLTDMFGVRRIAAVGIVAGPLLFVALSMIGGSFAVFLALNFAMAILFGTTTSSTVFGRLVAQRFDRARGLALSLMACAPAAAAAIATPVLGNVIDTHGWRAAYVALAVLTALTCSFALVLIPRDDPDDRNAPRANGPALRDYPEIFRAPTFWVLIAAMLLCNLTTMVFLSQLKLILGDRAVDSTTSTWMVSLYVTGMLVGRFLCGLALDRFPAHIVSGVCMAMPAVGIFILASGITSLTLLMAAVATIGIALGAELDIGGYLVMRYFRRQVYSTVYSILSSMIGLSGAAGALLLSFTLRTTGGYALFLWIAGVALIAGAVLFLSLGRYPAAQPAPAH